MMLMWRQEVSKRDHAIVEKDQIIVAKMQAIAKKGKQLAQALQEIEELKNKRSADQANYPSRAPEQL